MDARVDQRSCRSSRSTKFDLHPNLPRLWVTVQYHLPPLVISWCPHPNTQRLSPSYSEMFRSEAKVSKISCPDSISTRDSNTEHPDLSLSAPLDVTNLRDASEGASPATELSPLRRISWADEDESVAPMRRTRAAPRTGGFRSPNASDRTKWHMRLGLFFKGGCVF